MAKIIDRIMRAGEGKILRELSKVVDQVNAFEPAISSLSDEGLRAKTDEFKARYFDMNTEPHHLKFREIMRTTGVLNKETNTFSFGRRCSFSWGSSKGRIFRGAASEPIEILNLRINSYEFAHQRIINPPLFYSSAIVRFLDELNIRDRSPINIIQS